LMYYIKSATDMMTDSGYVFMSAGVDHGNLVKVVGLILDEFRKIQEAKIGPSELKKAKEFLKGSTTMSLESTSAVATFFGDQELYKGKVEPLEKMFEKIDAVSAEDIQKLAKKIIRNNRLNLAVVGPQQDEEEIRKVLKV